MKTGRRLKKIPIPLAFFLTTVLAIGGGVLIQRVRFLSVKTGAETTPTQVRITNINSNSFTVSWVTLEKATGMVNVGETQSLGIFKKDIRDQGSTQIKEYYTHYVIVDNLQPETKYFFKIISADKSYANNQTLFEVKTAPVKTLPESDIAQGRVINKEGEGVEGAIVYLSLPNAVPQSALTDKNGYWIVTLSLARNSNLQDFLNYDKNSQLIEVFVQGDKETSSGMLVTNNDNPAPDIVLGESFNFSKPAPASQISPTPTLPSSTFSEVLPSTQSGFAPLNSEQELIIIFPSDNEKVGYPQPEFFGKGPKRQQIQIRVDSNQKIEDEVEVDETGQWKWSPPTPLTPGEHKITVTYVDKNGFVEKVTKTFIVLASEESSLPSFTATPSATLTPTSIPLTTTPIVSPTKTPSPTLTPRLTLTPTPTPYSRTTVPSTESGEIKPGTFTPTKFLVGGGLIILLTGILLLFK